MIVPGFMGEQQHGQPQHILLRHVHMPALRKPVIERFGKGVLRRVPRPFHLGVGESDVGRLPAAA